jgi:hypothetical protein
MRIDMKNIIVMTGASSGFGALAARALAIRWEEVFRAQGMKNPAPRIQMIEGFKRAGSNSKVDSKAPSKGSPRSKPSSKSALKSRTRGGVLGPSLLGSARHASIAVDRIRIAEASYWRTPISPSTILDLRQIANSLIEAAEGFWSQRRFGE